MKRSKVKKGQSEQFILNNVSFLGKHDLCWSLSQDDGAFDLETILAVVKHIFGWANILTSLFPAENIWCHKHSLPRANLSLSHIISTEECWNIDHFMSCVITGCLRLTSILICGEHFNKLLIV